MEDKKGVKKYLKYFKDLADLTMSIIIIAGLSTTAIVAIGSIAYYTKDNAKTSAECISNYSTLNTHSINDDCTGSKNDGENNDDTPDGEGEEETGKDEEEVLIPTSDSCFLLNEAGNEIIKYKIELEECTIDVVIPQSIVENVNIDTIGVQAFIIDIDEETFDFDTYNAMGITSVVFPETIKEIKPLAFYKNNIEKLVLPNSVENIGEGAFSYNKIGHLSLSENVRTIGDGSFIGNKIKSLKIPEKTESIGERAFSENAISGTIIIPNNITRISPGVFSINEINNVVFHDSIEVIGESAFAHNQIRELDLPLSLKVVEQHSFLNNQINHLFVGKNVELIKEGSFWRNPIITVYIGDSVKKVEKLVLSKGDERDVESIRIPDNIDISIDSFFSLDHLLGYCFPEYTNC